MNKKSGIAAIGLSIPRLAMKLDELAKLRKVDPNKYTIGLGCKEMSLCPTNTGVVELAELAAKRALANWSGDIADIGMIVVGTESGLDMSRPLSAWLMERLDLQGAIRAYEVKHACFGGTIALRQALEWKLSGNDKGQAALVIAVDQGLYEVAHPGEPTQGSGAVTLIIDQPTIAELHPVSYAWSKPAYDFWRPVGDHYPKVNGNLSLACYKQAVIECFNQLINNNDLASTLAKYTHLCFHVPFPKMVKKAFMHLGEVHKLPAETINQLFEEKIAPALSWNARIGNCYTASLWFAVANALTIMKKDETLAAFSYGSGFGAELLTLTAASNHSMPYWEKELQHDFDNRKFITAAQYLELREQQDIPVYQQTTELA